MTPLYIIVLPAAHAPQANILALSWDPTGGAETWTVPLYPQGGPYDTPTHYWACMPLTDDAHALFTSTFAAEIAAGEVQVVDYASTSPDAVLTALALVTADPAQTMP
jgi:hypothetical protein